MTKPRKVDLVLDGDEVKVRLMAERSKTRDLVHVDWVRFTCRLRNAPTPSIETLFPSVKSLEWQSDIDRVKHLHKILQDIPDADFAASAQAQALAEEVCEALGPDFSVLPELRKGHDFYKFRWSIVRNGVESGWVGFLASGKGDKQQKQGETIHCNVYGTACTFAAPGFNKRIASIVERTDAVLTRIDLALDFFDGMSGGMDRIKSDYMAGAMDHLGRRLTCSMVGDWCNGRSRSFYFGSKEAGKQTNVYEKGHQLFGPKDNSPWMRVELRYGNKFRVLEPSLLRNPSNAFAGASDWHATALGEAGAVVVEPMPVGVVGRLAIETALAEVSRSVRWVRDTASQSLALAFKYLPVDEFLDLVSNKKLPSRLQKFSESEVKTAYEKAFARVKGSGFGRVGLQPI